MRITFTLDIDRKSRTERSDDFFNGILDRIALVASEVLVEETKGKRQPVNLGPILDFWNSLFQNQQEPRYTPYVKAKAPSPNMEGETRPEQQP